VFTEPGTARQEAERLVAAGLAFASLAASAHPELAPGSAACCVCPFCKLIEAVRDPDPQLVERLATGAGDLAVGVAGLLRSFSGMAAAARSSGDPWSAATAAQESATEDFRGPRPAAGYSAGTPGAPKKAVAKKAVAKKAVAKKAVKKAVPRIVPDTGKPDAVGAAAANAATPANPPPKKAVPKKAIKKTVPRSGPEASG